MIIINACIFLKPVTNKIHIFCSNYPKYLKILTLNSWENQLLNFKIILFMICFYDNRLL